MEGGQDPSATARQAYFDANSPLSQAQAQAQASTSDFPAEERGETAPTYPFPQQQQQDGTGPSPFKQYSQFYPRSPPRSRASSVASLSSTHDSLASTDPSDAFGSPHTGLTTVDKHPIRLHASGGQTGFLVEVSGGEDPGLWPVAWSELVGLLSNPSTSAPLPPDHLVSRLCGFTRDQLPPPGARGGPPMHPNDYYGEPTPTSTSREGYPGVTTSFEGLAMHNSPPMWNDDARSVSSFAGFHGPSHQLDDTHSLASFPPPTHRRRPTLDTGRVYSDSYVTPLQRAFGHTPPNYGGPLPPPSYPPSAILPPLPPLPDLSDVPRRREGPRDDYTVGRRSYAREAGRPYPSHSSGRSISSMSSAAAMEMANGEFAEAEHGKPLRALNRDLETYVWKEEQGQLYRVSPGAGPVNGELLVFPPGSYHKVCKDDLEIIPSDAAPRSNDWIRGQSCVAECKGFRIENKRPATIRHHFASCKLRDTLSSDPIGRLCRLQIDAGKRQKAYVKTREHSTDHGGQSYRPSSSRSSARSSISGDSFSSAEHLGFSHDAEDDEYQESENWRHETASLEERSSGGGRSAHQEQEAPTEQALLAMMAGSSSASTGANFGADGEPELASGDWGGWLSTHGLQPPTGDARRLSTLLPDEPNTAGSFLQMDE